LLLKIYHADENITSLAEIIITVAAAIMTIRELGLHLLNPRVKTCEGCTATEVHLSSLIAAAMP